MTNTTRPSPRPGILNRMIFAASNFYMAALIFYFVCRLVLGSDVWWIALINAFVIYTFAPAYILAAVAALAGLWRTVARLALVILISVLWFGPFFQPKSIIPAKGLTVKIVTFNMWGNSDDIPTNFTEWVLENPVDVLVIQEPDSDFRASAPALDEIYPEKSAGNVLIMSRYPIIESIHYERYIRTVLDVKGTHIAVYGVHMNYPFGEARINLPILNWISGYDETRRNQQIDRLIAHLQQETIPYIVVGDFNMSQHSVQYSELAVVMSDSFRSTNTGLGSTWSAVMPTELIRIDYIWHSRSLRAVHTENGPFLGSDHLPVVGTIEITEEPPENVVAE